VILLRQETGNLRWSAIRHRLWLNTPRAPQTNEPNRRLWWWLIPFILLTGLFDLQFRGTLNKFWVFIFPLLAQPPGFDFGSFLNTPETKAQLVGDWGVLALFVVSALFNTVLGEELLFRGLLLPRMAAVCGKWDWLMNGLLFGLYHLHQPWGILSSVTAGIFFYALPSRYFRSSWFGIIAHSGQSVFLTLLLLGLVLGLA
jgi:membrane protease YdiL (CAAX protease family)